MWPLLAHANLYPCLTMIVPIGSLSSSFAALLIWASVGIGLDFAFFAFVGFLDFEVFLGIDIMLGKPNIIKMFLVLPGTHFGA